MPKHYCSVCNQPMRKTGPNAYLCPAHPDGGPALATATPASGPQVVHKGGGYYAILLRGRVVDTVRGAEAAKKFAAGLG